MTDPTERKVTGRSSISRHLDWGAVDNVTSGDLHVRKNTQIRQWTHDWIDHRIRIGNGGIGALLTRFHSSHLAETTIKPTSKMFRSPAPGRTQEKVQGLNRKLAELTARPMDGTMPGMNGRTLSQLHLYAAAFVICCVGCQSTHKQASGPVSVVPPELAAMPRELSKTVLPEYVIEPPDILTIETVHAVPKSPYSLKTLDVLSVRVLGTLPDGPIGGAYPIEPGGVINLGPPYGVVSVSGLTVPQAQEAVEAHLKNYLKEPEVAVALTELGASQRLVGQYLVGPDGTVTLGSYGSVSIVGLTVANAKWAIEQHLEQFLEDPVISLSMFAYNSKNYYVILQGAELGDAVYRYPITGNDTVLDAIAQVNGLEQVSSKKMWIARPSDDQCDCQVLPVDWYAVTECGSASTNFQLMPGDRLFVSQDKMVAFDNKLAKTLAPLERIMGFSLLGVGTTTRFSGNVLKGGGNPQGFGGGF